jgi:hypothetical protein
LVRCRRCPLVFVPLPLPLSSLPVSIPQAVARGGVDGCCWFVVIVAPAPSPRRPCPRCSPFPPHEQLLAAAVGGDVVVVAVIILVVSSPLLLSRGGGTGSSLSVLTSLPHLVVVVVVQSVFCPLHVCTPQAVACGGCCGGSGGGTLPSSLLLTGAVVFQSRRLPTIHPASSGSQQ